MSINCLEMSRNECGAEDVHSKMMYLLQRIHEYVLYGIPVCITWYVHTCAMCVVSVGLHMSMYMLYLSVLQGMDTLVYGMCMMSVIVLQCMNMSMYCKGGLLYVILQDMHMCCMHEVCVCLIGYANYAYEHVCLYYRLCIRVCTCMCNVYGVCACMCDSVIGV